MDFSTLTYSHFEAFLSVLMIDLVMSADNSIVIALAVQAIPQNQRRKVLMLGVILATALRVVFALLTSELLKIDGILFFGGLLLLYVCYKMYRDLKAMADSNNNEEPKHATKAEAKASYMRAVYTIIAADVSMSLDNVLAVAGAAHEHPYIMIMGLGLAIIMMATLSDYLSKLMHKYRMIGWIGLAVIVYVSIKMLVDGYEGIEKLVNGFL